VQQCYSRCSVCCCVRCFFDTLATTAVHAPSPRPFNNLWSDEHGLAESYQFRVSFLHLLGPFYGAIVVPSVTRCRCCCCCRRRRGHRCAGGVRQWRRATVATSGEWQCKIRASCGSQLRMGPTFFISFLFSM